MKPTNLIVILSDEHNKRVTGCYGHPQIKTPNLDKLAARGTRFTSAYTNCPICVPARASFATGQYVHKHRCWDNAIAYDGEPPSWGHRLMAQGHRVTSIGKLHYQDSMPKRNGFDEEILPMHIVNGVGDLLGLIRDELPVRQGSKKLGPEAGPGESEYTQYDRDIADANPALADRRSAQIPRQTVGALCRLRMPALSADRAAGILQYVSGERRAVAAHVRQSRAPAPSVHRRDALVPVFRRAVQRADGQARDRGLLRSHVIFSTTTSAKSSRRSRRPASTRRTRVLYSSDHGDNLGTRGMWGKSTMYEESAGIPMILAGPEVPQGNVCDVPVMLADAFQTLVEGAGARQDQRDAALPGHSLIEIAQGFVPQRTILSEYHAAGAMTGAYMIRHGKYKYIHYAGLPPMLFDLAADPDERTDLGRDPNSAAVIKECEAALRKVVDPDAVNKLAKADQSAKIAEVGGKDAILKRGTFRYSPPPGSKAAYY